MAKAKRNIKTHPKPTGDDVQDDFMPPDRPDVSSGQDTGRTEVVDVFGKETVTVEGQGGDEDRVDLDSASEGDARSMASEDGNGQTTTTTKGRSQDERRGRQQQRATTDDDGEGGYGRKVRQRIARERALVNRERALREQTQKQLTDERAARQAQDERIAKLERATAEVAGNSTVKEVEAQIATLRPQLAAAMEAGETAKSLDLQEKLSDLKAKLEVLKYDLQQKQRAAEAAATTRTTSTTTTTTESTDTGVVNAEAIELANQFKKANRHWWNRSANKEAREDAFVIDKEILQEITDGDVDFEPYSDEHFEEMARRLHEAHPHLELQDLDGQPYNFEEEDEMNDRQDRRNGGNNGRQTNGGRQQQNARGNAPVGRMGQNGRKAPNEVELARQGKVQLDENDFSTMRLFKMDPNDPNAKKYFAKEKMRSILSGQRGNEGGNR